MKRLYKQAISVFLCLMLCLSVGIGAVACAPDEPKVKPKTEFVFEKESDETIVRKEYTFPGVTVTDTIDGDLTSKVLVKVYFEEDEKYVFPAVNPSNGALLSENKTFTPTKVGNYKIIYFLSNSRYEEVSDEIALTVKPDTTGTLNPNRAAADVIATDWIVGAAEQNSTVNEAGEMVLASNGVNQMSGAVYKKQKIENGDIFSFSFKAEPVDKIYFYTVSYFLSKEYDQDAPTKEAAVWPEYFNLRITPNYIESYLLTPADFNNMDLFPRISLSILDGNYHTISLQTTATTDQLTNKIWVDTDTSSVPTAQSTVTIDQINEKYGDDNQHAAKLFNEDICGWFGLGANYKVDPAGIPSNDSLTVKAFSINNDAFVGVPELNVENIPQKMLKGAATQFPEAEARDSNDYTDLSDKVELYVKAPGAAAFEKLDGFTYTPSAIGVYTFRYMITDPSKIKEYQDFTVTCSQEASDIKPTIEFGQGATENLKVAVNTDFAVPVPTAVTDNFGNDLSSLLKVSIVEREAMDITGKQSIRLRSPGKQTIRYEVTDYNLNTTTVDVPVEVTAANTGNILSMDNGQNTWWYFGGGSRIDNSQMILANGTSVAYAGQKIYDEKVSMLLNLSMSSAGSETDGSRVIMMNIRGGPALDSIPNTEHEAGSTGFDWPTGLTFCFSADWGLRLCATGYDGMELAKCTFGGSSMREVFHQKNRLFSFQVTDVKDEDGTVTGVKVQAWLDREPIQFAGAYADEDGNVLIPARVLAVYPHLMQAGYLSMHAAVGSDTENGTRNMIKGITLDGTEPKERVVTLDGDPMRGVLIGTDFAIPQVTVMDGIDDISDQVKKFIWVYGEEKPDLNGAGFAGDSIKIEEDYLKGFTIIYALDGAEIQTVTVFIDDEISNIVYSGETTGLTANIGEAFDFPKLTSFKWGDTVIDDAASFNYRVEYIDHKFFEDISGTTFAANMSGKAKICCYYGETLVAEYEVKITGLEGDLVKNGKLVAYDGTQGNYRLDPDVYVYNQTVSAKVTFTNVGSGDPVYQFRLRGNVSANGGYDWPLGITLGLCPVSNQVRVRSNAKWYADATTSNWYNPEKSTYIVEYQIWDQYDAEGNFEGVRVDVWIDGVKIFFNAGDLVNEGLQPTDELFFPKSYVEEQPAWFDRAAFCTFTTDGSNLNATIDEIYFDGTKLSSAE